MKSLLDIEALQRSDEFIGMIRPNEVKAHRLQSLDEEPLFVRNILLERGLQKVSNYKRKAFLRSIP